MNLTSRSRLAGRIVSLCAMLGLAALSPPGRAESAPSADEATVALWLFDEPQYISMTLTDAGRDYYDLRLTDYGQLVAGRFGGALRCPDGPGPAVAFACAPHVFDEQKFRSPELWHNRPPTNLIAAFRQPAWTVECWLKPESLPPGEATLMEFGTPGHAVIQAAFSEAGKRLLLRGEALAAPVAIPLEPAPFADGQWHHLAIVRSGANYAAFLDGRRQGSAEPGVGAPVVDLDTPLKGLVGSVTAENGSDPDQPGKPAGIKVAPDLDFFWRFAPDMNWAERWRGTIQAPVDDDVEFWIDSVDGARLTLGGNLLIDTVKGATRGTGRLAMRKDQPLSLEAVLTERGDTRYSRLFWRLPGTDWTVVPPEAFRHTVSDEQQAWAAVRPAVEGRFYFQLGSGWLGHDPLATKIDELRVSREALYAQDFTPPGSFSRNYGPQAPAPTVANGLPLLFGGGRGSDPVALGSRKHVFIDDVLLDARQHLRITPNPPQQGEPTTIDVSGDVSYYDDGDEIRFMSNAGRQWNGDETKSVIYMSRTKDGIHGEPPSFSHLAVEGDVKKNVCLRMALQGRVIKDPNPAALPGERYKFSAYLMHRGVFLFTSADGIRWRRNETLLAPFDVGGGVEMYWDDQRGTYVNFIRNEGYHDGREPYGRAVARTETHEPYKPWPFEPSALPAIMIKNWSLPFVTTELPTAFAPKDIWHKDPERFVREGQVYRSRAIKYPWAPDTYLAFPWRLYGIHAREQRSTDMAVSRDGVHWTSFEGAYFPYGWEFNGTEVVESLSADGLVRRGDELWQFAEVGFKLHAGNADTPVPENVLLRYKQRLDGFVSLDAGKKPGWTLTRPIIFDGNRLELNVAAVGSVRVGLYDEHGAALPGFTTRECDPISDDSVRRVVSWGGNRDVRRLAGKPVRLRFEMQEAKLYALQFVNE